MSTPNESAASTAFTAQTPPLDEGGAASQKDPVSPIDPLARKKGLSLKTLERRLFKFDMALLVLVLVLAFFLGSFAAHNSDVFLHLGMASPFQAEAGENRWVHHAWLSSLLLRMVYEPYSGPADTAGRWAVVLKALVVVVMAGVLCLIRRRGQSWLLPISCTALAVLVMSPRLMLQPVVVSLLFQSVTLWVLTLPAPRAARAIWFLPILFAVWVNMDQWFLLGPMTVTLWLLGLFMQQRLQIQLPAQAASGRLPLKNLAIVLALGLAACLFNPWGYRAFTLPVDLAQLGLVVLPRGMAGSARAAAQILENDPHFLSLVSPFSSDYWSVLSYGKHAAGLAYFVLFFLGVASFVLPAFLTRSEPAGPSKSPASGLRCNLAILAVFLLFAALSAVNFRFIPFFAVVAGPIAVLNLQDYGRRKKTSADLVPMAEVNWALGRRMAALAGTVLLLVCAWGGWLHSFADAWRGSHHVAWFVAEDPGVLAAAQKVHEIQKQTGLCKLGFNYLLEGGNVFTWSSYRSEPGLRLMCDTRYAMSTDAADAYGKIRKSMRDESLTRLGQATPARDQKEFINKIGQFRKKYQDGMRRAGADYVILTGLHWDQQTQLLSKLMLVDTNQWVMLFNDGRTAVFGWVDPAKTSGGEAYRNYRLNLDLVTPSSRMPPNVLEVVLDTSRLAPVPKAPGGEWHQFLYGPTQPALSWFESKQYIDLAMFLSSGDHLQEGSIHLMFAGLGLAAAKRGWEDLKFGPFLMQKDQEGKDVRVQLFRQIDLRPPGALLAAVRAGRNAVLEAPEDMRSYVGLGQAYQILLGQEDHWMRRPPMYAMHYKPDLRHQFRVVTFITAFQDAAILQPDNWLMHDTLHAIYLGLDYIDLSLEQLILARKSLDSYKPSDRDDKEKNNHRKENYDQRIKQFAEEVQRRQDAFKRNITPRHNVVEQFQLALFNPDKRDAKGREQVVPRGLIQQGLQILLQAKIDLPKDDPEKTQRMLHDIASWQLYLLLTTGEAREANERLKDEKVRLMLPGGEYEQLRAMAAWALGDYAAADKYLEQAELARGLPPDEQILKQQQQTTKVLTEHLAASVALVPGPYGLVDPLSRLGVFQARRHEILETLYHQAPERRDVAELRLLRGLLAMELGDATAAAKHFRGCLSALPTGLDLPDLPISVRYLELLEGK